MNNPIAKRLGELGVNDEVKEFHHVIHWRRVLNDAVVGTWERMPEIVDYTLRGLVEYLKKCPGWDINELELDRCFETYLKMNKQTYFVIDYGLRDQFLVPGLLSEKERIWLKSEKEKSGEVKCMD